jgi:hypothetical protein
VSAIVGGIIVFSYQEWLKTKQTKVLEKYKAEIALTQHSSHTKWEIKRNACLKALSIIDAHFSNLKWSGTDSKGKPLELGSMEKQPMPSIQEVRQCYNELTLSCDEQAVPMLYKRCLLQSVKAEVVVDLRNAIRKELGFGAPVDFDRSQAFIMRINPKESGQPPNK